MAFGVLYALSTLGYVQEGSGFASLLERSFWSTSFCWSMSGHPLVCYVDYLVGKKPTYFWRGWAFVFGANFFFYYDLCIWMAALSGHSFPPYWVFLWLSSVFCWPRFLMLPHTGKCGKHSSQNVFSPYKQSVSDAAMCPMSLSDKKNPSIAQSPVSH
jgi:hypothetical protein